jgi:SAM-dependent methyltransferase
MFWRGNLIKDLLNYIDYQINLPRLEVSITTTHLDLGCGAKPRNPFDAQILYGTDFSLFSERILDGIHFVTADLTKTLPFKSETFSSISAFDVLEHIPRWERLPDGSIVFPFVCLMQEIHRVLKPGGIFYAVTPGYPSKAAFQDPTHVNFITKETLLYFSGPSSHSENLGYGFNGEFEILHNSWLRGSGPYAAKRIEYVLESSRAGMLAKLRLIRRGIKMLTNRRPEHILWVIKKS